MDIVPIILNGPGPFQVPVLTKVIGIDPGHPAGWLILETQTEAGQSVLVPISAAAARMLSTLLQPSALEGLRKLPHRQRKTPPKPE